MKTQTAETIQIRDVIMPPERELRLWMRRHITEHKLPESALYLNVTGIYESSDKRGKWLHFKTKYSDNWPGGSYAFTFKARPETPWQVVASNPTRQKHMNPEKMTITKSDIGEMPTELFDSIMPNKAQHSPLPDAKRPWQNDSTTCIDWKSGGVTDEERIANLQFSLRNEVDAHVKAIKRGDHYKAHADKLAEALRDIKAKLGEHEGKGDRRQGEIIIEAYYKANAALEAYEAAQ